MFKKYFCIPKSISIQFFFFNKLIRVLLFKTTLGLQVYIKIPSYISFNKFNEMLVFNYNQEVQALKFFRIFSNLYIGLKYKVFESILIRGVGLKMSLVTQSSKLLQLKLGHSHLIFLFIPLGVNVVIKKKKLLVEGINKVIVGNFVNKIVNLKFLNIYTGKGLWLKSYKKFILKEIKKV
jgi:ribosomal protein L6P/L9E